MSFDLTYGLLFEVTILHNYYLDNGEKTFAAMSADDKEKMLKNFSVDSFLTIQPTLETNTELRNHKMLFKKSKTGFRIYTKIKEPDEPFLKIPASLTLNFIITINNFQFENFTNLDFAFSKVFLFSNVKPLTEPITFQYLPKINETKLISNSYLVSEETTADLISTLHPSEKQGVFGLVSLTLKGDKTSGNIITSQGKLTGPNFKIHFDNRKTLWKYINRKAKTEIETNAAKPLTQYGFVEIDPLTDFTPPQAEESLYANPSAKSIKKISGNYYSEIFI
ncbi:hypothetical protein [Flavobacterium gelatinilyticum]|uniref:hypothetical protein n=1 Tax=Flavobacterium gelatinilyticum TaxID=3003260 RepID=UPI00248049CF|nr:hypothetical protein [Flavobacterium gelatinilyticum]